MRIKGDHILMILIHAYTLKQHTRYNSQKSIFIFKVSATTFLRSDYY